MNFILCSEKCRHQEDGYCCLSGGARVTNSTAKNCCYFEENKGANTFEGGTADDTNSGNQ